jgi:hypothetical protein
MTINEYNGSFKLDISVLELEVMIRQLNSHWLGLHYTPDRTELLPESYRSG